MSRRILTAAAVAAFVVVGGISGLSAEETQHGPAATGQNFHRVHMQRMCADLDAHLAAKLAFAESKLAITDAQRPAWKKLTETLKAAQEPIRKECATRSASTDEPVDLPTRLKRMQGHVDARAASLRNVVPAVEQFYAALTPEQKKIADTTLLTGDHHAMHRGARQHGGASMQH